MKKVIKKSCKTFAELKFVRIFAPAIRNKEVAQVLKRLFNNVNNSNVENFSKKCFKKFGGLKKSLYLCTCVRSEKRKRTF